MKFQARSAHDPFAHLRHVGGADRLGDLVTRGRREISSSSRGSPKGVTVMRIVAPEEHFTVPALVERIDPKAMIRRGFRSRGPLTTDPNALELLRQWPNITRD